jgi:Mrp family chromosome partitioning ATPase
VTVNYDFGRHGVVTFREYLDVVARRRWLIAATVLLALAAAAALTLRAEPRYAATSEVLLSRQNPLEGLTARRDPPLTARRYVNTQARIARSPVVAQRTLRATGVDDRAPRSLLDASSVQPVGATDVLRFLVEDGRQARAARLATEYAEQFLVYRRELDSAAVDRAQTSVNAAIDELERGIESTSDLRSSLEQQRVQLRSLETAVGTGLRVVSPATTARKIRPTPARAAVVALGLGLIGGVLLAFLAEAIDTRARSSAEIRRRLGLPLLARMPARRRRAHHGREGTGHLGEAAWTLRTNVELANARLGAETIMVAGATAGTGTSTVAADLAAALAHGGRHVVLADLDLRRPSVARRFGAADEPGVAEIAAREVSVEDALVSVALGDEEGVGSLRVLPAGRRVDDPATVVIGSAVAGELLEGLRARTGLAIIDAPGLLEAGEALALTARVDALIVVVRLGGARRPMLAELRRSLEAAPVPILGVVVTGAGAEHDAVTPPEPPLAPARSEVSLA